MREYSRSPTKVEQVAAALACLVLAIAFGVIAAYLWSAADKRIGAYVFSVLSILCLLLTVRVAFTRRRPLSPAETNKLAWFFVIFGVGAIALILIIPTTLQLRAMVMAPALTFLGVAIAHLRGSR